MNDPIYPDIEFEVMYGYYKRGELYPEHDFEWLEGMHLDMTGIICGSNDMIAAYIDKHLADPEVGEIVYFYYKKIS